MSRPEFDQYSASYEDLLKDPVRDGFSRGGQGFYHLRRRDLIRDYFRRRKLDSHRLRYLDVGCGRGELLSLLRDDFSRVNGCDTSPGMLSFVKGIEARVQEDPLKIPFGSGEFDFVTAVCVFHHVPPANRLALAHEISRVLKPGGVFAVIEHNPYNPVARMIVRRSPVDADAILLKPSESRSWMGCAGLAVQASQYFLYLPGPIYSRIGQFERLLIKIPFGGQYAAFGIKKSTA